MKYKEKTHGKEEMILPASGMVVGRPGRHYQNNNRTHTYIYTFIHTYIYAYIPDLIQIY